MKKVNNTKGFQGGGYGSKRTTQMIEKNQPKKENIKPDNRVLVTDSNGQGLWMHVKKEEEKEKVEVKKKVNTNLTAGVEKKVEKSVINMLEEEIEKLTIECEECSAKNQQLEFSTRKAIQESQKHLSHIKVLEKEKLDLKDEIEESRSVFSNLENSKDVHLGELRKAKQDLHSEKQKEEKIEKQYKQFLREKGQREEILTNKIHELEEQLEEYMENTEMLEAKMKELEEVKNVSHGDGSGNEGVLRDSRGMGRTDADGVVDGSEGDKEEKKKDKLKELINENLKMRKRLCTESENRRQMQEVVRAKEEIIRKHNDRIATLEAKTDNSKASLNYANSQLSQKNAQLKVYENKIQELTSTLKEQEALNAKMKKEKAKIPTSKKKEYQDQECEFRPVKAKPYLFGPE